MGGPRAGASRRPNWLSPSRWRQGLAASVVLVLGLVATGLLAGYSAEQERDRAFAEAQQRAQRIAERVTATLSPMDSITQAIQAYLVASPTMPDQADITSFMQRLYQRWGTVRSIAIAPDDTVSVVVPQQGNESIVGTHYPDLPDQWADIERARDLQASVLSGPLDLVQGGSAFLYRTPVFLPDGSYWGVVSAVIDADTLLESSTGGGAREPDAAIFEPAAGSEPVIGSADVLDTDAAHEVVVLFDRAFDVTVASGPADRTSAAIVAVTGAIASLLLALLVYLLAGAIGRERALTRLMSGLSAQAPGMLFQLRQDREGRTQMLYASAGIERLRSMATVATDPDSDPLEMIDALVDPDDREALDESRRQSAATGKPWHHRFRIRPADGSTRWLLTDAQPYRQDNGDVIWNGWVGDVTDDVADEDALRVSASLFEVTRDGVIILNADGRTDAVNAGFTAMTGYTTEDVVGLPFGDYTDGHVAGDFMTQFWDQLGSHGYWRGEITGSDKAGHVRTDTAAATAVQGGDGRLRHYVVVLDNMDITRDDAVTGLPSALTLDEQVRLAVERSQVSGERVAVVILGLDQFRQVNDSYGHRVGDELLRAVAHRLRGAIPPASVAVRLRGDEFAILLPAVRDVVDVEHAVAACLAAVATPVQIGRHLLRVTAAVGVCLYPDEHTDATELPTHANQAMRAAKALGPNQVRYFTADMQIAARERVALVDELGAALRRAIAHLGAGSSELSIVLQPVVNATTGEVHRAEALIRWTHPRMGPIRPDMFIPLAEQAGLVSDLGDFVFAEAVRALVTLRDVDPAFQVAVNLSPIELREPADRHARRLASLSRAGLTGDCVIAEITEGALLSQDATVEANMATYRAAGLRFAIDDFGTGYSSLAYLMELDVQFLKIDRSFVEALAPGGEGLALCQAIIAMARTMGLQVIAEGVETQQQHDLLAAAGCDFVQGYLHSPPRALADLLTWLRQHETSAL